MPIIHELSSLYKEIIDLVLLILDPIPLLQNYCTIKQQLTQLIRVNCCLNAFISRILSSSEPSEKQL